MTVADALAVLRGCSLYGRAFVSVKHRDISKILRNIYASTGDNKGNNGFLVREVSIDECAAATSPVDMENNVSVKHDNLELDISAMEVPCTPNSIPQQEQSVVQTAPRQLDARSKERAVPVSRIGRMLGYGGLAAGLGVGALGEVIRRQFSPADSASSKLSSPFLTEANAERIVNTLCRMRGAALKIGQLVSIQDSALMPPEITAIFDRVRSSADFMPIGQIEKVLIEDIGPAWRNQFKEFDSVPFAAASIGQVHRGVLLDDTEVAVKIQYPGIARSIDSDVNNLLSLLRVANLLPRGSYIETTLSVGRTELGWECDYNREATYQRRFRESISGDSFFYVPRVVDELSSQRVLTTEMVPGEDLEAAVNLSQNVRNHIGERLLKLAITEIFELRFMQTDPNWSNFMYDANTERIALIDFGASRDFPKAFTDDYIKVIRCAAVGDRRGIVEASIRMGFLTGFETQVMVDAHVDAVTILGEPFASKEPFDFGKQNVTTRIHALIPIMLRHRLTPPPIETYSLHRKLSGIFLLCTKLNSKISVKNAFDNMYAKYKFGTQD